jgi:hypothetical protein
MERELDPYGEAIVLDDVVIRTPGLAGHVRTVAASGDEMRSEAQWTSALSEALANENVEPQIVVEMSGTEETDAPAGAGTRSTSFGEPAIELEVPGPSSGWGQLVLYTDESGVATWEFAASEDGTRDTTRGSQPRTYVMRRTVPPAAEPAEGGTRGVLSSVGKKVFGVLAFKLIDPIVGEIGESFAERWEAAKRPYRLRTFAPDSYRDPEGRDLAQADWANLGQGKALLFVHGTFSRAHTGFSGLSPEVMKQLHNLYEGRVFAFDHFTLSHSPQQNIEWLLSQLPDDVDLDIDIVCHSRGGLVSRTLAEKQGELSSGQRRVNVGKLVFVASPNAGTILTDTEHMSTFIDTYTNLFNFVPDNGVTEVLEGIITVAKHIAVGAVKGLRGLQSMHPSGDFLKWLNVPTDIDSSYYALAGNFEPTESGWAMWAQDHLMDAIFKSQNDLVVPTEGVFAVNGSSKFPIAERLSFDEHAGINHSTFFADQIVQDKLLSWLGAS